METPRKRKSAKQRDQFFKIGSPRNLLPSLHFNGMVSTSRSPPSSSRAYSPPNKQHETRPSSPDWKSEIHQILRILQKGDRLNKTDIGLMVESLDKCSSKTKITGVKDNKGFDIIQGVISKGCYEFMEHLLIRGFVDCNDPQLRTPPLHFACKTGETEIVRLLLRYGANIKKEARIPYALNKSVPLYYALMGDHIEIVKMLVEHEDMKDIHPGKFVVDACRWRAVMSTKYLTTKFPNAVHYRDQNEKTVLTHAFLPSGTCYVQSQGCCGPIILHTRTEWSHHELMNCGGKSSTILHVVFSSPHISEYYDCLQRALAMGFDPTEINAADRSGNTPLHILMRQVGRRTKRDSKLTKELLQKNIDDLRHIQEMVQEERDDQVLKAIQFLLKHGADMTAFNNGGESPLHLLISNNVPVWKIMSLDDNTNFINVSFPQVNRVLELVAQHGANFNITSTQVAPLIMSAAQILSAFEVTSVDQIWPEMKYCFTLLLEHGADPNAVDEKDIGILTMVFTSLHRWLTQCSDCSYRACRVLTHVKKLTDLLFAHGLSPPNSVVDLCSKQIAILCNINSTDQDCVLGIKALLVSFFSNGIDPNSLRMVTESPDKNTEIPTELHAQFYLTRAFIIHRQHSAMKEFFGVFENSLTQTKYNNFIKALVDILQSNFTDTAASETSQCVEELLGKIQTVRSLKQLSRVSIAASMDWKLVRHSASLPLPMLMKNYIISLL